MDESKELICCFTGHRNIDESQLSSLREALDRTLETLIARGFFVYRTGGALGIDTLAALAVLEKKEKYPSLRLHLCLPCRDQSDRWGDWSQEAYGDILQNADEVRYTTEQYRRGCMHQRNRQMVQGSQCCVAYCTSEDSGSAYTLQYAKKHGLRVINLSEFLSCDKTEGEKSYEF